jgi:hypothetical protein
MATKKSRKPAAGKKKISKRKRSRNISGSQTNQPFEQDVKRRIGQFGGAGDPPIMK